MDKSKNFRSSIEHFIRSEGKWTFVTQDEICSNFLLAPDELTTFLQEGESNLKLLDVSPQPRKQDSSSRDLSRFTIRFGELATRDEQ